MKRNEEGENDDMQGAGCVCKLLSISAVVQESAKKAAVSIFAKGEPA